MKITIGVLAHVDAGKTTFSERVLSLSGSIRTMGRVDHGDAFLDAHPIEQERGITIFSDQALIERDGDEIFWVDTPGHADFSPEMERAVSVMDAAVVVVSCAEGVQSHTETVFRLLRENRVPTLIFLNKIDREGADAEKAFAQMKRLLSADVIDARGFAGGRMRETLIEEVAARDESLMDRLFEKGYDEALWLAALSRQVMACTAFPVMAGSALRGDGVEEFMRALRALVRTEWEKREREPFRALVYKIRHDAQGGRLCFFKVLSGSAAVRDEIETPQGAAKLSALSLWHGPRARSVERAAAGELCACAGLAGVMPGDTLGAGAKRRTAEWTCEPMLAADAVWDAAISKSRVLAAFRMLEEEESSLQVEAREGDGGIAIRVMGEIQLEVLREVLKSRFGLDVSFGPARVLYRETVKAPCVGIGHYEPLRHYAEVWLRLVPTEPGSGVTFRSLCHVDTLALNWQRLIETHVLEKQHKGVLTGAPLTDVRVELLTGRAHIKHTEGGDFRQSVYRAIRNALMHGESRLLEPICRFSMRAPEECYGRLAGDLSRVRAQIEPPEYDGDRVTLRGEAPFAALSCYQTEFLAATHGKGALTVRLSRYAPCRDEDAARIVAEANYNPLADDTPDSVFCQKGAGFRVAWDHVREWAHCEMPEGI